MERSSLVHEILHTDLDEFGEGLVDEDEWDQERENLLSETRDESNQEASLKCYHEHHDYDEPEPNPYPTRQVLQIVTLTELLRERVYKWWRHLISTEIFTAWNVLFSCNGTSQSVLFFLQPITPQSDNNLIHFKKKPCTFYPFIIGLNAVEHLQNHWHDILYNILHCLHYIML